MFGLAHTRTQVVVYAVPIHIGLVHPVSLQRAVHHGSEPHAPCYACDCVVTFASLRDSWILARRSSTRLISCTRRRTTKIIALIEAPHGDGLRADVFAGAPTLTTLKFTYPFRDYRASRSSKLRSVEAEGMADPRWYSSDWHGPVLAGREERATYLQQCVAMIRPTRTRRKSSPSAASPFRAAGPPNVQRLTDYIDRNTLIHRVEDQSLHMLPGAATSSSRSRTMARI